MTLYVILAISLRYEVTDSQVPHLISKTGYSMKVTNYSADTYYYIKLEGDLDTSSSLQVDQVMQKAVSFKPSFIWVDCAHLQYISSAGLGVFISYLQKLEEYQISLRLYNMKGNIRDIFNMLGLDKFITILPAQPDESQPEAVITSHINQVVA